MELPEIEIDRTSKFTAFARELDHAAETNPPEKAWLKFPDQTNLTEGTRGVYRWRINIGELLGDGYEAAVRAGWLYARKRP